MEIISKQISSLCAFRNVDFANKSVISSSLSIQSYHCVSKHTVDSENGVKSEIVTILLNLAKFR